MGGLCEAVSYAGRLWRFWTVAPPFFSAVAPYGGPNGGKTVAPRYFGG